MNRANKNNNTQINDYKSEHHRRESHRHVTDLNNYKGMNRNNILNFNRLVSTFRQDFSTNLWKVLLASEALWGVLVISLLYFNAVNKDFNLHEKFYSFVLVFVGLFVASISFGELNDKKRGHFFLILPASSLEKFLSRFIYSTIGYVFLINIVFYTASLCAYGIDFYLLNNTQIIFDATNPSMITAMLVFLILHSVFFFGSVYFRKLVFLKMILVISGLILFATIIGVIEMKIILWEHINIFSFENFGLQKGWMIGHNSMRTIFSNLKSFNNFFLIIIKSGIVSLFFILLSYLRLKETEL